MCTSVLVALATWYTLLKGFFFDLFNVLRVAFPPTLRELWHSPGLLLQPCALQEVFMGFVWVEYGDGLDVNKRDVKEALVRPHARGVVLDIGAGHAHLAQYLPRPQVTAYVALEPNVHMHERLRARAADAGFTEADGTLLVLPYGAEDTHLICAGLADWAVKFNIPTAASANSKAADSEPTHVIDTLITIFTLCTVPSPTSTLRALVAHTLRPGGQLLFYEHVRSPDAHVARLQDALRPLWAIFFGRCRLGMDGVTVVREAGSGYTVIGTKDIDENGENGGWESLDVWPQLGEPEQSLFYHQAGRAVKRS